MNWMEQHLAALTHASLERTLRASAPVKDRSGCAMRGGRVLLNLSSNDYLGLSGHPAIAKAMSQSLAAEGAGSGGSRLVTGNRETYERLEQGLADWQQSESAIVFSNGYMANSGVISALVGRGDVVFSDRLNHASIADGITLSRAEHARYRHLDMEHLQRLLNKHSGARRKLIVTDAVFSMDGDKAPLRELAEIKQKHGAMLMVDEAHSGGIYGRRGEGLCHSLGLHGDVDIHIGTFGKAFGVYGAYASGSSALTRWLVNKARPFIYSTALPPSIIAGIAESLELVQQAHWRRESLSRAGMRFRETLRSAGFQVDAGDSPIVPLRIGHPETALRFGSALEEEGILAVAIRPPTVPEGTSRIRFSLSAAHTPEELDHAAERIRKTGLSLGVLKP
ncbi:8-amino-7-oxononanoate synthase [Paenibacillus sp. LHD-117]|uniref:8-amino-7-oxononanoate synthase n=1 Tax=Paenibacillus sp. LHD-117 TaxID=3071412 RepID=UPI0027DEF3B6|nr:8-amino-7-oxononanoate synthase [Paenibacillus sp. LHD-117]MDQ6419613.1 8-amino-7-oxononanoate synthase [Paenibacillus sp. LHD-117]